MTGIERANVHSIGTLRPWLTKKATISRHPPALSTDKRSLRFWMHPATVTEHDPDREFCSSFRC
jgi:hypothetical protein